MPSKTLQRIDSGFQMSSFRRQSEVQKALEFSYCGREAEILQLEGIFRRSASGRASLYPNLALVGGVSGVGKSTLTKQLQAHLGIIEEELFWIQGKFQEGQQVEEQDGVTIDTSLQSSTGSKAASTTNTLHPFAAIVDAFSHFFLELEEQEPETLEEVRADILEAVGQQGAVLTAMIPSLVNILGGAGQIRSSQPSELKRFHLVFRQFVQALASQVRTVVIVLDDIHRADAASLDLLHSLMTNKLKHVMFIGTFRSDEVGVDPEEDRFTFWIKSIEDDQAQPQSASEAPLTKSPVPCVTRFDLSPMDLDTINSLVSDAMALSQDDIRSLAHIIFTKTEGNAFYATQYLLYLKKEGHLWFDMLKDKWDWDEEEIRKDAEVTTTLADFMRQKLSQSRYAPMILPVAACLGAKFNLQVLAAILDDIVKVESLQKFLGIESDTKVQHLLRNCEKESFIEGCGDNNYNFAHDKLQEAASTYFPSPIMQQIRFRAGVSLFRNLSVEELEEKIFVIVNLLNTSQKTVVPRFELAQLNLNASDKAKHMAAFGSAATYLEYAYNLCPHDLDHEHEQSPKWRDLILEVCSKGAEVEAACGRFEQMDLYCKRIFDSGYQYTVLEQLRIKHVLIDNEAYSGGKMALALKDCLAVLEQLGCRFPKGPVGQGLRTVSSLLKGKSRKNIPSLEDVNDLGLMMDPMKVEAMRLMDRACTYAYTQADQLVFTLCTTRMARWTLRYGMCDKSPAAIAMFGVVLMHVMGDTEAGMMYGKLALSVMHKMEELASKDESMKAIMMHCQCRVYMIVYSFIIIWNSPVPEYKNELLEGYKLGMNAGDTENALLSTFFHIGIRFSSGATLTELEELCRNGVSEMTELQRAEPEVYTRVPWQAFLNLMQHSPAEGTTELSGSAMTELDVSNKEGAWNSKNMPNVFSHMKIVLCAFFGDYEQGAKLAIKQGNKYLVDAPGGSYTITDPFYRGVCLYGAAGKTKNLSYKYHAKKCRSTVRTWVKNGNQFAVHQLKLLDAENEACFGTKETAKKLYLDACGSAVAEGFVQDAALATERYAQLLFSLNDIEQGKKEVLKSLNLYRKWGAQAKIEQLWALAHPPEDN